MLSKDVEEVGDINLEHVILIEVLFADYSAHVRVIFCQEENCIIL